MQKPPFDKTETEADVLTEHASLAAECCRIVRPGETCWRYEHVHRIAFLIDGAAYFRALRSAITQAERSVLILAWEFHSRVSLLPEHTAGEAVRDGWPVRLAEFLWTVVERKPRLQVHILVWDFAMIYALECEFLPIFRLPWKAHRRIHLRMDGEHPPGASHHQKVVVIDDRLAFCGGLDVTANRWDTPEHSIEDPRRVNPAGESYRPFHDVQMMVDGAAAAALGDLARERWRRATGWSPRRPRVSTSPWPDGVAADLHEINVAIARTEPAWRGRREVREIERLHQGSLMTARRFVYIENQFFTSVAVGDAIVESLRQAKGPEIVLVLPYETSGWLEETAMGIGRTRLLRRVRAADRHGRLAIYYPVIPKSVPGALKVHSKVTIVDDRLARIGSANLENRSMGLDSECDLAIEEDGRPETAVAIAGLRNRLLAEHLGCAEADVAAAIGRERGLIAAIEALRGRERTLVPFSRDMPELLERWLPETDLLDPERPIEPEELVARLLPTLYRDEAGDAVGNGRRSGGSSDRVPPRPVLLHARQRALLRFDLKLGLLVGLVLLLSGTPLLEVAEPGPLLERIAIGLSDVWSAAHILGIIAGGAVAFIPPAIMILTVGALLGPFWGALLGLAGSLLGAVLTFGMGAVLGRSTVRRLGGRHINRIGRRIGRRATLSITLLRLAPLAPFAMISLIAGASRVGLRDFATGTALGMAPGTAALAVLGDRLAAVLQDPNPRSLALAVAAFGVAVITIHAADRWVSRWRRRRRRDRGRPRVAAMEEHRQSEQGRAW